MTNAIVLFSGGMDSTVVLLEAIERRGRDAVSALLIDYGQRHAFEELWRAERIARSLGVAAYRIRIEHAFPALLTTTNSATMLHDPHVAVVPWRNTVFAIHAAQHALARGASEIWIGCCAADAAAFPDCRPEWVSAMSRLLEVGDRHAFTLVAPLIDRTKAQIVRRAHGLGPIAWHSIGASWSCYSPNEGRPCRSCAACGARARGFDEAGIPDPGAA